MKLYQRSTALLTLLLVPLGCRVSETTSVTCTDHGTAGVALALEDSITGAKFPFSDVVAVASEGLFRDTARVAPITGSPTSTSIVALVFDRAGTYDIEVKAAGYATWRKGGIVVKEEPTCHHVVTRWLTVKLRRQP